MGPTEYKEKLQREACYFGSLWTGKEKEQHQNYIRRKKDTSNDEKLALEGEFMSYFSSKS